MVFIGEVDEMLATVAWKYVLEGFQMPACFNSVAIMDMRLAEFFLKMGMLMARKTTWNLCSSNKLSEMTYNDVAIPNSVLPLCHFYHFFVKATSLFSFTVTDCK